MIHFINEARMNTSPAFDVTKLPKPESIEKELEAFIPKHVVPIRGREVTNSVDMAKIKTLLHNAVTDAHDDTCAALDRVVKDAATLMTRLTKAVEEHKEMLHEKGKNIALTLEAAVQELTLAVEWAEEQTGRLRNPEYKPLEKPNDIGNLPSPPTE